MYRSDPRYWWYILARDFEAVWDKLFTYKCDLKIPTWSTEGYIPLEESYDYSEANAGGGGTHPSVLTVRMHTLMLLRFWVGSGGGGADFWLCCCSILVRGQATALVSCSYVECFHWNYWPQLSATYELSQGGSPCFFSLGEVFSCLTFSLHYRKSDLYRWRNSTLIDSWKQTCYLHSALL